MYRGPGKTGVGGEQGRSSVVVLGPFRCHYISPGGGVEDEVRFLSRSGSDLQRSSLFISVVQERLLVGDVRRHSHPMGWRSVVGVVVLQLPVQDVHSFDFALHLGRTPMGRLYDVGATLRSAPKVSLYDEVPLGVWRGRSDGREGWDEGVPRLRD